MPNLEEHQRQKTGFLNLVDEFNLLTTGKVVMGNESVIIDKIDEKREAREKPTQPVVETHKVVFNIMESIVAELKYNVSSTKQFVQTIYYVDFLRAI